MFARVVVCALLRFSEHAAYVYLLQPLLALHALRAAAVGGLALVYSQLALHPVVRAFIIICCVTSAAVCKRSQLSRRVSVVSSSHPEFQS